MSTLIKNTLLACGLALAAGALVAAPSASAAPAASAKASDVKKPAAKAGKARAKAKAAPAPEPDSTEPEPDITDTTTTEFECELGNRVTTYHNVNDDSSLAVRWKKRLHRLTRVGTTTGAQRFENTTFGLIWIGIPAKGMLLDSKLNRQLANECKNAEQMKPPAAPAVPVPAIVREALIAPVTGEPVIAPVTPVAPPPPTPAAGDMPAVPPGEAAPVPATPMPPADVPAAGK